MNNDDKKDEVATLFESVFDAIMDLPVDNKPGDTQGHFLRAYFTYWFQGKDLEETLTGTAKTIWKTQRGWIREHKLKRQAGAKGGKRTQARKKKAPKEKPLRDYIEGERGAPSGKAFRIAEAYKKEHPDLSQEVLNALKQGTNFLNRFESAYPLERRGSYGIETLAQIVNEQLYEPQTAQKIIDCLPEWEDSYNWTKENGRYIPKILTFFADHYWERDPEMDGAFYHEPGDFSRGGEE